MTDILPVDKGAVDISHEAVEEMAEWCESGGKRRTVRPSEMLRALRAALTARDEALMGCIEHMEWSTMRGRAAYNTARALLGKEPV